MDKQQIIKLAIVHKDRFFESNGFRQQHGQKIVSDSIITNVLLGTGKEIGHCVSRQAGKTTIIVWTTIWLLLFAQSFWEQLEDRSRKIFEAGIFAPQREQAKTAFDRLKDALDNVKKQYDIQYEEANGNTLKISIFPYKSIVYTFSLTPTSQIESKSLDYCLFDESQKLPNKEMFLKAFPMLASTKGVRVYLGTAGYELCYYYELLNRDTIGDSTTENYIYDVYQIIEQKNEMYKKTGDKSYLKYEEYFQDEVKKHGINSDYIKTQFLLKWNLEKGMFVSPQKMVKMCIDIPIIKQDKINEVIIGIDCAKESDSTVAVAWRWEMFKRPEWTEAKQCIRVLDWYVLNKELYSDQWEILQEEFLNNYNVHKLNIDGTGPGDGTGDWFLKQYDNINYEKQKLREANGRRGIVRPVKFSSQSKNKMYKELQKYIDNDLVLIPIDSNGVGYNKFVMESRLLLKEYKGDLLSVHHDNSEGATDDCWDALACTFFDIDLEPIKSGQGIRVAKFKQNLDIEVNPQRNITNEWLSKQLRLKHRQSIDRL